MPLFLCYALRECRHGKRHFAVLFLCMTLAASVTATISIFESTIAGSLRQEAQSLLGGDIEFHTRSGAPLPKAEQHIRSLGDVSYIIESRTMLNADSITPTLVELKAIDTMYPLIGTLDIDNTPAIIGDLAPNEIYTDSSLYARTGLKVGDTVRLGRADYIIKGIITKEPDRAVQLFAFGPRVMLTHDGLKRSGLTEGLSLARHAFRVAAPRDTVYDEGFEKDQEALFRVSFAKQTWGIRRGTDGNDTIQRFINRFFAFLTLSGLATFLIAGSGAYGSVRAYAERKAVSIAILKSLGASRALVLRIYATVLFLLASVAGITGIAIACIGAEIALPLLSDVVPALKNKSVRFSAALPALIYVYLFCASFAAPVLLNARDIAPATLFRSGASILRIRRSRGIIITTAMIALLTLAVFVIGTNNKALVGGAAVLLMLAFGFIVGCSELLRYISQRIRVRTPWLSLAWGNIGRSGSASGAVMFAFGVSLTVLITLTLTETNLRARITDVAEKEAPALFMIDIQPFRKEQLSKFLTAHPFARDQTLYPMIRGRIERMNDIPVRDIDIGEKAKWMTRGDRGLSYADTLPENSDIISGEWRSPDAEGSTQVSVDSRLLEATDLEIGDILTMNVQGRSFVATITSARDIDYTGFQINFAMMFNPEALTGFPATYVATVYETSEAVEHHLLRDTAEAFPEITIISTKEIVDAVKDVMNDISTALRAAVAVTLLAGALVLMSALSAALEQRMYDIAVLKTLGARRADIIKACLAEWTILALSVSVIACSIGTAGAFAVNRYFEARTFDIMPEVMATVTISGILLMWLIGFSGNRRLFHVRPARILRNN